MSDAGASLGCAQCGSDFPIQDGIPVLRKKQAHFYWGIAEKQIESALETSREAGWTESMHRFIDELPTKEAKLIWSRTFWPMRSTLQVLLNIRKTDTVLEIGPGWGAIALFTAPNCRKYVVMDQIHSFLKWVRALATANERHNLDYICSGDTERLPFGTGYFDKVIMNGVFEWVASNTSGKVGDIQQRLLHEIKRVLKPDGQLYIGIENRINYRYFRGSPEGHINMKYGALLPRRVTKLYLKLTRNQSFREYTYTIWGYRKLLRNAGLSYHRFFSVNPVYSEIRRIFPVGLLNTDPQNVYSSLDSDEKFSKTRYNIFSHCFGIIASGQAGGTRNIMEDLLVQACSRMGVKRARLQDSLASTSNTGKSIMVFSEGKCKYVLSIALNQFARHSLQRHLDAVAFMKERTETAENIKQLLPDVLFSGAHEGFLYSIEQFEKSQDMTRLLGERDRRPVFLESVFQASCGMAGGIEPVTITRRICETLVTLPMKNLTAWFSSRELEPYQLWFEECETWLSEELLGASLPLVPRHGDFVPDNLRARKDMLSCILDWECFSKESLPMHDMVMFIGNAFRQDIRGEMRQRGIDPSQVAFHGYPDLFFESRFQDWMLRYIDNINVERRYYRPLLFMWWVNHLNDYAEMYRFHPEWKSRRVKAICQRWQSLLEHSHVRLVDVNETGSLQSIEVA